MDSCPVRVAVRVRPLSSKEENEGSGSCLTFIPNTPQIVVGTERSFTFDHVFSDSTSQDKVYEFTAKPLVEKLMDGFNTTIFAYGQTGSGKTYSMGTSVDNADKPEHQGIVPRAVDEIFRVAAFKSQESPHYKCEVMITFLELYNEDLIDLLNPNPHPRANNGRPVSYHDVKGPTIREDPQGGIYWKGVKEVIVSNPAEVMDHLYKGLICRTTASTEMNATSSRSHAIFSISLHQIQEVEEASVGDNDTEILTDLNDEPVLRHLISKFHFVDLAGSERLKKTHAVGGRAKEGISINAGLLALGNVISALGDESRKSSHIPYRDSKLTRLLQDSIGGNSQTLMLACISPAEANFLETLNTLKYANRARNIKNRVQVNQGSSNPAEEISRLKSELSRLKQQLHHQTSPTQPSSKILKEKNELVQHLQHRVNELTEEITNVQAERDIYILRDSEEQGVDLRKYLTVDEITDYATMVKDLRTQLETMAAHTHQPVPRFEPVPKIKISTTLSLTELGTQTTQPNYFQANIAELTVDNKDLQAELEAITKDISNMDNLDGHDDTTTNESAYNSDAAGFTRRRPKLADRVSGIRSGTANKFKSVGNTPLSTPPELPEGLGSENVDQRTLMFKMEIKNLRSALERAIKERDLALKVGRASNGKDQSDKDSILSPEGSSQTLPDLSNMQLERDLRYAKQVISTQKTEIVKLKQRIAQRVRAASQMALRDTKPKKPVGHYSDYNGSKFNASGLRAAYKKKLMEQEIQQFLLGRRSRKALTALIEHKEKLLVEQQQRQREREGLIKAKEEGPGHEMGESPRPLTVEELDERLDELEAELDYTHARIKNQELRTESLMKPAIQDQPGLLKDDLYGESNYRAALKILHELEEGEVPGMLELMLRDLVTLKMSQWNYVAKIKDLTNQVTEHELLFTSYKKTVSNITLNYEARIHGLLQNSGLEEQEEFDPFRPNPDIEDSDEELDDLDKIDEF